jgi:hypothetical protein
MQFIHIRRFILASITLLCVAPAFAAGLEAENLLQALPDGYKIAFQDRQGGMLITEMVPKAETADNWTEMVTAQVFFGLKATPRQFKARMDEGVKAACPDAESVDVIHDEENGYPISIWMQVCPLNPSTGKPEYTWFKAIQGNDSFYVVQKAFKYAPSKEEVVHWMEYFRQVSACDTRLPASTCPVFEK